MSKAVDDAFQRAAKRAARVAINDAMQVAEKDEQPADAVSRAQEKSRRGHCF